MKTEHTARRSERGAVLIQVAVAMVGLLAFGAFVIDYGIMWTGRGQIQTSADAGALAGAISLAWDSPTDFAGAKTKARAFARANNVWGAAPDVQLTDVTFPPCPPGSPGLPDTCVKVDAFRNQTRGNPLPTYFGNLVGVSTQGVRSTATAQIVTGNSTDCLKPWAILDRWIEFGPEGPNMQPTSTYDKYSDGKGQHPPPEADVYTPPSASSTGTGFTLPADQGRRFAVKTSGSDISSGWFREIMLPRADGHWTGGSVYNENIESCGGLTYAIAAPGTVCPANIGQADAAYWATQGCFGVKAGGTVGPTRAGIEYLVSQDSGATYVPGTGPGTGIVGSTFDPPTKSPRVVPIGVMDIDDYLSRNPTGSNGTVRLVNIYGFFIEGMGDTNADGSMTLNAAGKAVIGRLIRMPSLGTGASVLPANASFLVQIILVR
jgi:hypothetical protein